MKRCATLDAPPSYDEDTRRSLQPVACIAPEYQPSRSIWRILASRQSIVIGLEGVDDVCSQYDRIDWPDA